MKIRFNRPQVVISSGAARSSMTPWLTICTEYLGGYFFVVFIVIKNSTVNVISLTGSGRVP